MRRRSIMKKTGKLKDAVPSELIGVLAEAFAMGATSFRLEPNPPHITASFSAGSHATEIDFYARGGRKILEYLAGRVAGPRRKTGRFVLELYGKRYECKVTVDRKRDPQQAEVTWT